MVWYNEFNSTFWLSIGGSIFGLTAILIKAFKSSKCKQFKCLCIECIRDVQLEERIDELELQQQATQQPNQNQP